MKIWDHCGPMLTQKLMDYLQWLSRMLVADERRVHMEEEHRLVHVSVLDCLGAEAMVAEVDAAMHPCGLSSPLL